MKISDHPWESPVSKLITRQHPQHACLLASRISPWFHRLEWLIVRVKTLVAVRHFALPPPIVYYEAIEEEKRCSRRGIAQLACTRVAS